LQFGEEIRLSGNVPALGCNTPDRGIALVTSSSEFPWWQTKEGNLHFCRIGALTVIARIVSSILAWG
jgi:hypothetical protein